MAQAVAVKLNVSILICAGAPAETEPMSRLAMRASISSGLSLGTIDINAWAGVTTPPMVWMASC